MLQQKDEMFLCFIESKVENIVELLWGRLSSPLSVEILIGMAILFGTKAISFAFRCGMVEQLLDQILALSSHFEIELFYCCALNELMDPEKIQLEGIEEELTEEQLETFLTKTIQVYQLILKNLEE